MSDSPTMAVTYTVKDEARLLPSALDWYRALGVRRFYVFLDGTSDRMREWLPDQDDVVVRESVRPNALADPPNWIGDVEAAWDGFIDARKNLNSWVAAREAASEGIPWLAMIDPDELLLPDPADSPTSSGLSTLLDSAPAGAAQVLLPNCDVLAGGGDGTAFGHRHFLARHWLEPLWRPLRKAVFVLRRRPDSVAAFDHAFWKAALRSNFPRELVDPRTSQPIPTGYFLSYASHKSIVRTASFESYRPFIHYWAEPSGRRRGWTAPKGRVLHFDLPDAEQFIHKFSQRRGHREFSPVHFSARRQLTEIASTLPPDIATQFFKNEVEVGDQDRVEQLIDAGVVLDLPQVPAFFATTEGLGT